MPFAMNTRPDQVVLRLRQHYTCEMCGSIFLSKELLSHHVQTVCNQFRCKLCPSSFDERNLLKWHMAQLHGQVIVSFCTDCGKGFKSKSGYYIHRKIHHSTGNTCPRCKTCGKFFGSRSRLAVHERIHSGETILCSQCGKHFRYERNLKKHTCVASISQ